MNHAPRPESSSKPFFAIVMPIKTQDTIGRIANIKSVVGVGI